MIKNQQIKLRMQYFFKYGFRLLSFVLFIVSVFYFSLALESYVLQRQADKFAVQYIDFKGKKSKTYVYEKDIYFIPQIAAYQTNGGSVYLCINNSISQNLKLDNIQINVTRKTHGETKTYEVSYSDFKEGGHRMQCSNFDCFAFLSMKLHVDYNNLTFAISGIDLPDPDKNLKIMMRSYAIKGRIVLVEFLFKGIIAFVGCILTFYVYKRVCRNTVNVG
jgi:hypothetical protein